MDRMPANGLLIFFPGSTTQFQLQHICKSNKAKMSYPDVNIILGWLDFQALISVQRSLRISCEQEQDDAPHVSNTWATGSCKRHCTVSSFFSHNSVFLTSKDYKWALWDPLAELLGSGMLCISNISVWCVISQMQLNSLMLSSGNEIGHTFGQHGATWNKRLFTAHGQKSCVALESDFPECHLSWPLTVASADEEDTTHRWI